MRNFLKTIRAKKRNVLFVGAIIVVFLFLGIDRIWSAFILRYQTHQQAIPIVKVIKAQSMPTFDELVLPGTIKAWHEAPIYARINGYLKQWYVDIGDKVTKGELLAVIDAPDLDAELRQAEADLNVAITNYQLAAITAKRWVNLVKTHAVSKQETDEKVDRATALNATVISKRANRDRLKELVGFKKIIAPFAGVISDRTTDIGALINYGSRPAEAKPLFRVAQHDPLRLYIKIPEAYSSRIKPNLQIQLTFAEYPQEVFSAQLFQTAEAIDPKTRTLLAQFTVKNSHHLLFPGAYTEVHLKIPETAQSVQLPVTTLIFRSKGLQVATIDKQNRIVLKKITVKRDFGETVEVVKGVKPGDAIIIFPTDSIFEGQKVRLCSEAQNQLAANPKKVAKK